MPTAEIRQAIRQIVLFSARQREIVDLLVVQSNVRSTARDKPLFQLGDPAEAVIVFPDDCAKLFRMSPTTAK